jgi:hypothetical protein
MKSHLYGILEAPGFKGFPSKSVDSLAYEATANMKVVNAAARVGKKLSNGRTWTEYGKPLPKDTFPNLKEPQQGFVKKFTNPEVLMSDARPPTYPDEQRTRAWLAKQYEKEQFIAARDSFDFKPSQDNPFHKKKELINEKKLKKLLELGFTEEQIKKVVDAEAEDDIRNILNRPELYREDI